MRPVRSIAIPLALLCAGCASCPSTPSGAPWFHAKQPTQIVAHVDAFRDLGAFIDFPNDFARYHSIDLLIDEPDWIGWKRVHVQFQGVPMVNGRHLELGQRLRFTLPVVDENGCCAPYLKDLADIEFLDDKDPKPAQK